jgi:hypothetical protein
MATLGHGVFADIPAGEEFAFAVDARPVAMPLRLYAVVAYGMNAVYRADQPAIDSDGDGVIDGADADQGTDPVLPDTDADGFRDGLESWVAGLNPREHNPGCLDPTTDTDRDGLTDCEESVVGTSPERVDSDGDFLLDMIEVVAGSSPLNGDTNLDSDQDGLSDVEEVQLHLDSTTHTDQDAAGHWTYQYDVQPRPADPDTHAPCYAIEVRNIYLAETLAVATHPAGGNVVHLTVVFGPDGSGKSYRYYQTEVRGAFMADIDYQEPATGVFELNPDDFTALH